jgi:hypothetical protein
MTVFFSHNLRVSGEHKTSTGGEVKNDACSQLELTWTNLNGPERPPDTYGSEGFRCQVLQFSFVI